MSRAGEVSYLSVLVSPEQVFAQAMLLNMFSRSLIPAAVIAAAFCFPAFSSADTFEVSTTTDAVDANVGDGVCLTAGGQCSLRAGVQEAMFSPGADTVQLSAGQFFPLSLGAAGNASAASGDFDITSAGGPLTVTGPSGVAPANRPVIDAGDIDRIFDLTTGSSLLVSDVVLKNGRVTIPNAPRGGGGLIQSFGGTLDIRRSSLKDAVVDGDWGAGGALYMYGFAGGRLSISDTLLSNNQSGVVSAQSSGGGALALDVVTGSGADGVTIQRSTFLNNLADHTAGGAIENQGSTIKISNSTFTGNQENNNGGAVLSQQGGSTDFLFSTLLDNMGVGGGLDSGVRALGGTISFTGSILMSSGDPSFYPICRNSGGTFTSGGYNFTNMAIIAANHTGSKDCSLTATGDNYDPAIGLGILADNGGYVQTFSPSPGSIAIDGGPATCASTPDDARGGFRPFGNRCDVGAVEVGGLVDAAVSSADSSLAPSKVGETGTVRFNLSSLGPDAIVNLATTVSWSAGLELMGATTSAGGSCVGAGCAIASLPLGSSGYVDVQVKAVASGTQTLSLATGLSSQNDFSSFNNTRQVNLSVAALPDSGGGSGGGSGDGSGGGSTGAAVLSGVKLLKKTVKAGKPFTVSFSLNKPASLTASLARKSGKKLTVLGATSKSFAAGASKWKISKIKGKKLKKGSYQVTLTPQGGKATLLSLKVR